MRFDREPRQVEETAEDVVFDVRDLAVSYAGVVAVHKVTLPIYRNEITALIGPSGCGKTTFLRCLNRMNDLIETARVEGTLLYHGVDLYDAAVDPVEVRRRIGMVFQKPNPFPKSIYDNIAFGPKIAGFKGNMDELVEESLRRAALWDEVKDKLKESGLALSGGQQQRLCIARAIATRPDVILMDEPCSALDPIATQRIEDLMQELLTDYTIVIVTHNMQQAARVSDRTAFFTVEVVEESGHRTGTIVEYDQTETIFTNPNDPRTEDYVTGTVRLMPRPGFHEELEAMELRLLELGELAAASVQNAVEAVIQHDDAGAQRVIDGDDEIDQIYLELDRRMLSLLALQAPVAADLRLISVDHPLEPAPGTHRRPGGQRREDAAGHARSARRTRRSSSRSARWGTSSSRWSASRWTRCDAATSSSACACRRWTTRSTASTGTCISRSPSSRTSRGRWSGACT